MFVGAIKVWLTKIAGNKIVFWVIVISVIVLVGLCILSLPFYSGGSLYCVEYLWRVLDYMLGCRVTGIVEMPVELVVPEMRQEIAAPEASASPVVAKKTIMGLPHNVWAGIGVGLVIMGGVLVCVWWLGLMPVILAPAIAIPSEALINATAAVQGEVGLVDLVADLIIMGHPAGQALIELQPKLYADMVFLAADTVPMATLTEWCNTAYAELIIDVLHRGAECTGEYARAVAGGMFMELSGQI